MFKHLMDSTSTVVSAESEGQRVAVPVETCTTAAVSSLDSLTKSKSSLGDQASTAKEMSTSGGAPVSSAAKASTHIVTNPVVPVKPSNSVIVSTASVKNPLIINTYSSLRNLPEVDIQEIPVNSAHKESDNQNGNSFDQMGESLVMDFDDTLNDDDDSQMNELAASKTQYVCTGCGKGFCYIGWLDRHKLQSKACRNADKLERVVATPNDAVSNDSPNTETILNAEPSKCAFTPKSDVSLSQLRADRQSLQGRLQELLQCPHPQCTFATYWLQSLTKHVNYTCKFGPVKPQSPVATTTSTISAPSNTTHSVSSKSTAPVVCTICYKKCNDVQEHIDHMTSVHKMKASYRCSTCSQTFPTKLAVEAHLQTHAKMSGMSSPNTSVHYSVDTNQTEIAGEERNKRKQSFDLPTTTSIEIAEDEDDGTFMNQSEVFKCDCGKVYLQKSSYEQHVKTCAAVTSDDADDSPRKRRSFLKARDNMDTSADFMDDLDSDHIKREQIREIHVDDFCCKSCLKEFHTHRSLCSHIARAVDCREWYIKRIVPEYMKNKDNPVYSGPNPNKRLRFDELTVSQPVVIKREEKGSSSVIAQSTDHGRRAASIAAETTVKLSLLGNYVESKEAPSTVSVSKTPFGKSIQCPKCLKVFQGKSPHVAYHNHLRSFKPCDDPERFQKNISYNSQVIHHPKTEVPITITKNVSVFPHSKLRNVTSNVQPQLASSRINKVPVEAIQQGVKYYCKLCPNGEIKNRVSLGCHLTIYHGLPQVNITTDKGESFRCQTCCKIFVSKYFYNMHRYDCDLTSPYVGVLNVDGTEANVGNATETRRLPLPKASTSKAFPSSSLLVASRTQDARSNFFSNSYKCTLCNKAGFWGPNAVKIHQKYQCVNRLQGISAKPYSTSKKSFKNTQKIPIRNNIQTMDNVEKNGDLDQDEEESAEGRMFKAKMNDLAKEDASVTVCNACGRGPYNSYYHFLEHKRHFCRALKGRKPLETFQTSVVENSAFVGTKAIKTITQRRPVAQMSTPRVTLEPTPRQTARKSMNTGSVQIDRGEPKPNQVSNEEDDDGFADDFGVEPQDQIVKCSTCGEEIENIEKFSLHKLNHISKEIDECASADTLKCEICNAKISHYQRMQQHLILHLQNFTLIRQKNLTEIRRKKQTNDDDSDDDEPLLTCPYCKANFVSRISLADHIRNACPSRYQCPKCQRTYLTKESLMEHKEQCIRNAALRSNSMRPAFKCRTCGLEFKVKQQLLWHEHACSKVYGADLAGRVEEIIQRTLTCGVCGMVSKDYENKLKHERRCLQRYLSDVGFRPLGVEEDTFSDVEPYEASSCDMSTVKSLSEKLDEETIKILKEKYGIFKDPQVLLRTEDIANYYEKSEAGVNEEEMLKKLKKSFENLLLVLLGDDVYKEVVREDSAEAVLNRMLNDLGEAPIAANGLSELTCFSQNLQTFLKLSIKEETLEKANHTAQSVEEVIVNLLTFPYELNHNETFNKDMSNWFYDKAELRRTKSIQDGISYETEQRYRREGARLIIKIGSKMNLRYDTMATGVVYFHRFYMCHSFKQFPRFVTACCCLFLAGKVEETPKKCKDIIKTARSFLTEQQLATFNEDPKEEVLTLERILLQTINFDLQVDHPYVHLLKYAKALKGDKDKLNNMVQMAWTFINDSLCTTICLQWEPEVIAIALMFLAGKLSKFDVVDWEGRTSKHTRWWDMYVEDVSIELLEDICHQVLDLYLIPMPDTPQDSPPASPSLAPSTPLTGGLPQSPAIVSPSIIPATAIAPSSSAPHLPMPRANSIPVMPMHSIPGGPGVTAMPVMPPMMQMPPQAMPYSPVMAAAYRYPNQYAMPHGANNLTSQPITTAPPPPPPPPPIPNETWQIRNHF